MDSRIAELVFDNSKFQKGVKESQETLKKFDKELDKVGENDGLTGISRAASKLSFQSAEATVNNLANRFSALGIIGMTALQNITNRAVNMGISMAKALTIEPVTTGLQEYELKMDNIRTTMVNTESDLNTVNAVLNDLNTYSGKTIYKFSDMTNALARLTTNGVKDLGLAKDVIQGMANAAAYAGLSNEKLQSIMYNTSQAYSLGYMSLMDFRSLENAGIGTKFKEVAIETAARMGTLKKQSDGTYKVAVKGQKAITVTAENMRNTLSGKWLTNDVMTEVFRQYSDETTELGKAASEAATQITTASKMWDTWKEAAQSGWAQNWELIIGDYEEAKKLWTGLNDIVTGETGFLTKFNDHIKSLLIGWKQLGGRTRLIQGFKNLWSSFENVFKLVGDAYKDIFPSDGTSTLYRLTNEFLNFTKKLKLTGESAGKLKRVFEGVFSIFKIGRNFISSVGRIFRLMIPDLKGTAGGFLDNAASLGDLLIGLSEYVEKNDSIFNSLKKVYDVGKKVFEFLANTAETIIRTIEDTFGIDIRIPTFDELLAALTNIRNFFKPATDAFASFENLVKGGFDKVKEIFGSIFGKEGIFGSGGVGIKPILGITAALYALFHIKEGTDPFKLLMDIFSKGFNKALDFTGILDDLGDALSGFVANVRVDGLLKISFAIGLLTVSLTILAAIDPSKLEQGITLLGSLAAGIVGIGYAMSKLFTASRSWKELAQDTIAATFGETAADSMIKLAGALLILSVAMMIFSKIDPEGLGVAIGAMVVSVIALVGAMYALRGVGGRAAKGIGAGLMSIAIGVLIMSGALKLLSTLSWDELGVGLTGLAASLFGLVVALKLLDGVKFTSMAGIAIAALGMGMALVALAVAMKLLSTISAEDMTTSIQGLAAGLIMIGLVIAGLSVLPVAGVLAAGVALALASVALIGFATALAMIAAVGEAAAPSLEILSGTLLVVAVALAALSFIPAGGLLAAAAAMLVVSVAMVALSASVVILAVGMAMLNGIEIGGIADGFLALAGPLALVGASLVVVAAGIVALSAALLLFAPAVLVLDGVAIAFGIFAVAAELVAGAIGSSAASFDLFVSAVERLASVKDGISGAGKAVGTAIKEMLSATRAASSEFKTEGVAIMEGIQEGIDSVPLTMDTKIREMLDASGREFDTSAIVSNIIGSIGSGLALTDFGGMIAGSLSEGLSGIDPAIMVSAAESLMGAFSAAFNAGLDVTAIHEVGVQMATAAATGAQSVDATPIGQYFVNGFANGIRLYTYVAEKAAQYMAQKAKEAADNTLAIHSPSRVMRESGRYFVQGFAKGIERETPKGVREAAHMAFAAVTSAREAVSDGIAPVFDMSNVYRSMHEYDDTWHPVIKPTLDMSGVNPGTLNANMIANTVRDNAVRSASSAQSFTDSRIVGEIAMLREQMAAAPAQNTSLYINGRKIASTIAGDMNRELNVLAKRG